MVKSSLASGHIIQLRSGEVYIIIDSPIGVLFGKDGVYNNLSDYNEDMTSISDANYDIIKVVTMSDVADLDSSNWVGLMANPTWERVDITTVSIEASINGRNVPLSDISKSLIDEIKAL